MDRATEIPEWGCNACGMRAWPGHTCYTPSQTVYPEDRLYIRATQFREGGSGTCWEVTRPDEYREHLYIRADVHQELRRLAEAVIKDADDCKYFCGIKEAAPLPPGDGSSVATRPNLEALRDFLSRTGAPKNG